MAWPVDQFATGELVTAPQLNRLEMLLASTIVAGSVAASIDFQSIPAHWTHLRVVIEGRRSTADSNGTVIARFNGDSGANYNQIQLNMLNATVSGTNNTAATSIICAYMPGSSGSAGRSGGADFTILSYADTTFQKSARGVSVSSGTDVAATQRIDVLGGVWRSTAAINQVTLLPGDGSNFAVGTRASIYGMGTI